MSRFHLFAALVFLSSASLRAEDPPAVSEKEMTDANNPLASLNSVNFHNYYVPTLNGVPDKTANTLNLRGVHVVGRQIIRATLPIVSQPNSAGMDRSGLGDVSIFDAIKLSKDGDKTDYAVGPLLVVPTATSGDTGAGKWQGGLSALAIRPMAGGSVVGTLVTWQGSFAGHEDREETNLGTAQIFGTFALAGGYYVRSTPIMVFDFRNDRYLVPWGLGVGKVFKAGPTMANAFIEAQPTIYHKGSGQPDMQLFMGLNLQWKSKGS